MTVVDASVVVVTMIDDGPDGPDATWALETLSHGAVAAPHLMPVEVASVLRRSVRSGSLSAEVAS